MSTIYHYLNVIHQPVGISTLCFDRYVTGTCVLYCVCLSQDVWDIDRATQPMAQLFVNTFFMTDLCSLTLDIHACVCVYNLTHSGLVTPYGD